MLYNRNKKKSITIEKANELISAHYRGPWGPSNRKRIRTYQQLTIDTDRYCHCIVFISAPPKQAAVVRSSMFLHAFIVDHAIFEDCNDSVSCFGVLFLLVFQHVRLFGECKRSQLCLYVSSALVFDFRVREAHMRKRNKWIPH